MKIFVFVLILSLLLFDLSYGKPHRCGHSSSEEVLETELLNYQEEVKHIKKDPTIYRKQIELGLNDDPTTRKLQNKRTYQMKNSSPPKQINDQEQFASVPSDDKYDDTY